jgi:hypothetical protein
MARSSNATDDWRLYASGDPFDSVRGGPWTIVFWLKLHTLSPGVNATIFSGYQQGAGGAYQAYFDDAANEVRFHDNLDSNWNTDSGIAVPDTNEHHYAYRKTGSGSSSWDKFFDGTKTVINASFTGNLADLTVTGTTGLLSLLAFDRSPDASIANECDGEVAEVGLYTTNLSDANIAALAGGTAAIEDFSPVHAWPLCGTASPEPDLGSANSSMTVSGPTQSTHPAGAMSSCGGPAGQPTMRRWRGVPFMGPGPRPAGRMWRRRESGVLVPVYR